MDITFLDEFLSLAETLNFTKSASDLHLAQSTLSKHVSMMEEEVDAKLFERSTNSVRLTRAGRMFYERALSTTENYREMIDSAKYSSDDALTMLKVCGNTILAPTNRVLGGMTVDAVRSKMGVRFEYYRPRSLAGGSRIVRSEELLESGETDLSLSLVEPGGAALEKYRALKVVDERCLLFVSADNPLRKRKRLKIKDLSGSILTLFAAYPDCPTMTGAAFEAEGFSAARRRVLPIEDMLEIPENLAMLTQNEITPLQESLCEFYGIGTSDSLSDLYTLDMDDDSVKVTTYLLARKDDDRLAISQAFEIAERVVTRISENRGTSRK